MTRGTSARGRALVAVAPMVLLLAGCFSAAEPPTDLDDARLGSLRATLWFTPVATTSGGPAVGPYQPYERPGAILEESRARTVAAAAAEELAAARSAGWTPVFGICPGAPDEQGQTGGTNGRASALVLHLVRELDDAPAFARVTVLPSGPDTHLVGAASSVDVTVAAYTLYHLDEAPPAHSPAVDVDELPCLGGDGPEVLGTPVPLTEEGILDEADKAREDREREARTEVG